MHQSTYLTANGSKRHPGGRDPPCNNESDGGKKLLLLPGGMCLIHLRNEASIFRSCSYGSPDIEASTDRKRGANLSEYKCSDRHEEDCNKLGRPHGEGPTGENTEKECQSKLVLVAKSLI